MWAPDHVASRTWRTAHWLLCSAPTEHHAGRLRSRWSCPGTIAGPCPSSRRACAEIAMSRGRGRAAIAPSRGRGSAAIAPSLELKQDASKDPRTYLALQAPTSERRLTHIILRRLGHAIQEENETSVGSPTPLFNVGAPIRRTIVQGERHPKLNFCFDPA